MPKELTAMSTGGVVASSPNASSAWITRMRCPLQSKSERGVRTPAVGRYVRRRSISMT